MTPMDEKVKEIEEKVNHYAIDVMLLCGPPNSLYIRDFKYLLSHISTLEARIKELERRLCAKCDPTIDCDLHREILASHKTKEIHAGPACNECGSGSIDHFPNCRYYKKK